MKKQKKIKLSPANIAALSLATLAVVMFGVATVKADAIFSWLRVEDKVAEKLAAQAVQAPEQLGAVEAPVAPVEEPVVEAIADEILGAVTGPELPNPTCQAGECTYIASGTFNDASTTLITIPSPFLKATTTYGAEVVVRRDGTGTSSIAWTAATTTVDMARVVVTGAATTSFQIICGSSASLVPTFASLRGSGAIISSTVDIYWPTSTKGVAENNLSAAQGSWVDVGSVAKTTVGSQRPYFTCSISPSVSAGITNALNTFDGKYVVRFRKLR